VDYRPVPGSKLGELSANIDIVLGKTLEELEDGTLGGGVAISEVQRRSKG
jgi:protocatechuate 3,4-dioxygenase beta subunit